MSPVFGLTNPTLTQLTQPIRKEGGGKEGWDTIQNEPAVSRWQVSQRQEDACEHLRARSTHSTRKPKTKEGKTPPTHSQTHTHTHSDTNLYAKCHHLDGARRLALRSVSVSVPGYSGETTTIVSVVPVP